MSRCYCIRVCLVLFTIAMGACNSETSPIIPPLELLAQDIYFSIADKKIRLPRVAVSMGRVCEKNDESLCKISEEEIYAKKIIIVDTLHIELQDYDVFFDSQTDDYIDIPKLCPMLSQEWARRICKTNGMGKHIDFSGLQRFSLVKESSLSSFNTEWLDNGNTSEMVQKMSFDGDTPSSYCKPDKQGNPPSLCTTAMRIGHNLLAIWVVTLKGSEKPRIIRDGQIIKAFIQFGIGEIENFAALNAVLQK